MKQNILVVDDDAAILELLNEFLTSEGFNVITAKNGEEGLKKYGADFNGLVVTDLDMPAMNGVEFLERLKKKNPDCVGIILTGHGTMATCIKSLREGLAYDYLLKPLDHLDLLLTSCRNAWQKKELELENKNLMDSLKKANAELLEILDRLKKTQDELVESKRVMALMEMAGAVAHEINNPLCGISNNIQLMLMKTDKTHPDYKTLQTIKKLTLKISGITKNIQEMSSYKTKQYGVAGDDRIIDLKSAAEKLKNDN